MRIGHGYDVHRLGENRKLIIGGVDIPYYLGLVGHSDGDVLTHAIIDSILGALGLRDIGYHFPDTDSSYKDINSLTLLEKVKHTLDDKGYIIGNIDSTIVAQNPKLSLYIEDMIENIAKILDVDKGDINIKATTEEKLGFTGEGKGISSHSVCLIVKK